MPDLQILLLALACEFDAPRFLFGNPYSAFYGSRRPYIDLECAGIGFLPVAEL